jgi:hypothetical protein
MAANIATDVLGSMGVGTALVGIGRVDTVPVDTGPVDTGLAAGMAAHAMVTAARHNTEHGFA